MGSPEHLESDKVVPPEDEIDIGSLGVPLEDLAVNEAILGHLNDDEL